MKDPKKLLRLLLVALTKTILIGENILEPKIQPTFILRCPKIYAINWYTQEKIIQLRIKLLPMSSGGSDI